MNYMIMDSKFVADAFESDILIANLETGIYYSVFGQVCRLLNALPIHEDNLSDFLSTEEIKSTYNELLEEGIIIRGDASWKNEIKGLKTNSKKSGMKKFDDLQDLLVLDPIHEIQENRLHEG